MSTLRVIRYAPVHCIECGHALVPETVQWKDKGANTILWVYWCGNRNCSNNGKHLRVPLDIVDAEIIDA
jgi:hypothetical protein